jgi:hypothetical protein
MMIGRGNPKKLGENTLCAVCSRISDTSGDGDRRVSNNGRMLISGENPKKLGEKHAFMYCLVREYGVIVEL